MSASVPSKSYRSKFLVIALLPVVHHFLLWALMTRSRGIEWLSLFSGLDAGWYTAIVKSGYDARAAAFYPLYPWIVSLFYELTQKTIEPQFIGLAVSLLCYLGFVFALLRVVLGEEEAKHAVAPSFSLLGFAFFAWSPASYVLTSMHTESLFLFLSFNAFVFAHKKKWLLSSVLAGLCALTKNQGVFVAIVVALWNARDAFILNRIQAATRFCASASVSFVLWAIFPVFLHFAVGDALAQFKAQQHWTHASTIMEVLQGFVLANSWQNRSANSFLHLGFFLGMATLLPALWKTNRMLALYVLLSLAVQPLQGEFVVAFRFLSFVYPLYFVLGKELERRPVWVKTVFLVTFIVVNHFVAHRYALGRWAY